MPNWLRSEDWLAVWIGLALFALSLGVLGGTDLLGWGVATAEWIDWYNHRRLHGEIGHIPPAEYEQKYRQQTTEPQVNTPT